MDDPTPTLVAVVPSRQARLAKIGLLGIAAAALLAVAVLALGAGATPTGTLAAAAGGTTDTTTLLANGGGPGGPGGHGFGGITITAISGSSISLETGDGWTRTITVDSGTTYEKSGATIALADLNVGDEIRFKQTRETDGTFTIDAIAVIPPHLGGTVTAISGSTITLLLRDGSTGTVTVNGSTTYVVGSDESAALADVKVGMVLFAQGTESGENALAASSVRAGIAGDFGPGGRGHRGPGDPAPNASSAPASNG